MAEITAATVKALREKTSLPMMECKQALQEANGDEAAAIELLRKKGKKTMDSRGDRETSFGRVACFASVEKGVGAMIELVCESDPVAKSDEFIAMANDMAKQLALGPGAGTAEGLLSQPSPSKAGQTLGEVLLDATNRIREVMKITRLVRIDSPCGAYAHFT
ncbi:MAG TPA: translation elongation factor Ts, partial [Pirellulales bacterium]